MIRRLIAILLICVTPAFASGNLVRLALVVTNYDSTNFPPSSQWLVPNGGPVTVLCAWSADDTGTTAPNFTGSDCASKTAPYRSIANGGTCNGTTVLCPIINVAWRVIQTPQHAGGNTFTPQYVFTTTYCAVVQGGSCGTPQQAVECNTAGGAYQGDMTFLNAVSNANINTVASVSTGLPDTTEAIWIAALKGFITSAKAWANTTMGNQLGYLRFGYMGPNDEQHDYCSAQLITASGASPATVAGLKTLWINTFTTFVNYSVAQLPTAVRMNAFLNPEQGGDISWMDAEADAAHAAGMGYGFAGVVIADLAAYQQKSWSVGVSTNWPEVFARHPDSIHVVQTTFPTCTNGTTPITGCPANSITEGSMQQILPFLIQHSSTIATTYYEAGQTDGFCVLVNLQNGSGSYTDATGCPSAGVYYTQYPSMASVNVVNGQPVGTSGAQGTASYIGSAGMQ